MGRIGPVAIAQVCRIGEIRETSDRCEDLRRPGIIHFFRDLLGDPSAERSASHCGGLAGLGLYVIREIDSYLSHGYIIRYKVAVAYPGKPEQQRVIGLAVQSGAYRSSAKVVDQAIEIIPEQFHLEDWMSGQREAIAEHIEIGFAQAERGELIDGDTAVEMLCQRRAERSKPQG